MGAVAAAVLYALFVWWFATGLVLFLVLRRPRTVRASLIGAFAFTPLCLAVLAATARVLDARHAYLAFTAAVVLWGTQEIAFLSGSVTGPRPVPRRADARGLARLYAALGAILYHEVALAATGLAVAAATAGGANGIGLLTYVVLWTMRLSAKLNLFLGVPVLNDEALPTSVAFLRSHFRRGPVTAFFPVTLVCATGLACTLVAHALAPDADAGTKAGYSLVAALVALAIIEHAFMLVPLRVERLWRWSTRGSDIQRRREPPPVGRADHQPATAALP